MILICMYIIVAPFFSTKEELRFAKEEDSLTLEAIYSAVNELEMDYLMKKIGENDYLQLKEQYQLLAAKLMKQEGQLIKKKKKEDISLDKVELEILEELKKIRKGKGS